MRVEAEKLREPLERMRLEATRWTASLERARQEVLRLQVESKDEIQRFAAAVQQTIEAVEAWPEAIRWTVSRLAEHGWYISPLHTFGAAGRVATLFEEGKHEEAHAAMVAFVDRRLEEHRAYFDKELPDRAHILGACLDAHIGENYTLSIPPLLAQADGIAKSRLGVGLYAKEYKTPRLKLAASFADLEDHPSMTDALLEPLRLTLPIVASESERRGTEQLNRHAVLHGADVDYGSKRFSCQAITLVAYVAWLLKRDR